MDTIGRLRAIRAHAISVGDVNLAREAEIELDRYGQSYTEALTPPAKERAVTKRTRTTTKA